jgi:hypothetical protein
MAITQAQLNGQRTEKILPNDGSGRAIQAIMLPVVNVTTGVIEGWIPMAYTVDADGKAILHVKVIP